jgi:hypothetical protein
MTSEQKAERLEEMANAQGLNKLWPADAALLRECAALLRERERGSLLTAPDWKTMYEAQERDLAALRKEREEAIALLVKFIKEAGVAE